MAAYREEEDPFEEDIVFDQAGLLNNTSKMNTAIRRVSSGKCVLFAKTLGLCGAFFGLGLCIAIPEPTFLPHLTALEVNVSNIYVARSSGYLIGAVLGGMLFDHFNRLFLLFSSLLLTSVFITVAPWCQVLWLQEACMVSLGITMGFLDTGGNVLCLDLWGRNSGPFMQALHFSFGLGAFVAPLLAVPFIEHTSLNTFNADMSHVITESPVHITEVPDVASLQLERMQRVKREMEKLEVSSSFNMLQSVPEIETFWSSSPTVSTTKAPVTQIQRSHTDPFLNYRSVNYSITGISDQRLNTSTTSIPYATARRRIPKRKPSTIGSKLDNENWDNVHVRTPPQSDLLPLTTVLTTKQSTTLTSPVTFPAITYSEFSTSVVEDTTTEKSSTTEEDTYSISTDMNVNGTQLVNINDAGDGRSLVQKSIPISSIVSSSTVSSYQKMEITLTTANSLGIGAVPEMNDMLKEYDSTSLSFSEATTVGGSDVSSESYTNSFPQPESSYLSQSDQIKNIAPTASTSLEVSTIQKQDRTIFQEKNKTSRFQSFSDRYTTNGKNVGYKEMYVQKMDSRVLPVSEEAVREINITTSTAIPNQKEVTSSLSYIASATVPKHMRHKPGTFDNDTEHINTIFDIFANRVEKYGFSKLQFSYLVVGIFVFLISVVFLGFLCHNPRVPKSKQEGGQGTKKITNKFLHKTLIGLMAFFFFLYMGMVVTYGRLVLAFAMHSNLKLTQSTGSVISIVFWGSFAAMRFASIFFASGFSPLTMLMLNFAFCSSGTILLSVAANKVETALWTGTALIGIGLASMFPTGILWIERYIHISNKVAAVFVIGVSLGEMICPITVYRLMVNDSSMLMHSALVINIFCILTFVALWWLASRQGEKYSIVINNGYQLANQNDDDDDMMDMSPSGSAVTLRRHSFSSEHRALLNGNIHRGP